MNKKITFFVLSLLLTINLSAQNWNQIMKATATDAAVGDQFGISVDIDGDYAIIGAYYKNNNSGAAYILKRTGNNWVEESKLLSLDIVAGDQFGSSVSIDGDYAVVGAMWKNDVGTRSGAAHIFKRSRTTWTLEAILLPSDADDNDHFGFSVALDGEYTIVGAHYNSDNGNRSGSAYIFKRTGTSWSEEAKLLASDADGNDEFGISVHIKEDYAIVGALRNQDSGYSSGVAYVFKRVGVSWIEEAKLLASDAAAGDYFGGHVVIDENYAIVAAYGNDDNGLRSGSVYVF